MAEPQTYSELQAQVVSWLVRDDLASMAPEFIGGAERRFNRTLRVPEMEGVSSSTVTDGTVLLPADFAEMRTLGIDTAPAMVLEQVTPATLRELYPEAVNGTPRHFALQAGNQLVLRDVPEDGATLTLNYWARIPALSDSNTSNWLLARHPDLYLAAAVVEGFTYTRDLTSLQVWEARAQRILDEIRTAGVKQAYSGRLRQRTQPQAYSWL